MWRTACVSVIVLRKQNGSWAHLWVRWSRLTEAPPTAAAAAQPRAPRSCLRLSLQTLSAATTPTARVQSGRVFFLSQRLAFKPFTMSTVVSETVFCSALQPNSSVTTYGLPSEIHLGNGSSVSDEASRARRVQQQVQMRLAEKSTLPRQNGSTSHHAMSGKHQQHPPAGLLTDFVLRFVPLLSWSEFSLDWSEWIKGRNSPRRCRRRCHCVTTLCAELVAQYCYSFSPIYCMRDWSRSQTSVTLFPLSLSFSNLGSLWPLSFHDPFHLSRVDSLSLAELLITTWHLSGGKSELGENKTKTKAGSSWRMN